LTDLFKISASRDGLVNEYQVGNSVPYISSTEHKNGIIQFVNEEATNKAGTITANRGGSVGFFFYQSVDYIATPVDVRILTPRFPINNYIGFFLTTIFRQEKYRFNYSRKMGSDRLAKIKIKLPVNKQGKPDFEFMENYIKSLPYSSSL
jgi:type I restriction enzyme M protein